MKELNVVESGITHS